MFFDYVAHDIKWYELQVEIDRSYGLVWKSSGKDPE
jgi:hypothetical protein